MAYLNNTTARHLGLSARLNTWISDMGASLKARRMYRETVDGLSGLSARELEDLGINRSEIRRVAWESVQAAR